MYTGRVANDSEILFRYFDFFFQAEDGIRDRLVTGVQTCALPIWKQNQGLERECVPPSPIRTDGRG